MSKPLVLLGARWLAEEMLDLISEIPGYEVSALVENMEPERCGQEIEGVPVVWVEELPKYAKTHLALSALGSTQRHGFIKQAYDYGMEFATLVHPSSRVSSRATLGEGCFVSALSVVSTKAVIGNHVFLNRGALLGHHVKIGDYCSIQCGANIGGLANIGPRTYIGMGAVILDRVTIGEGCVIAAGSVVTKDVPDAAQVMGVPARIVKMNVEEK